MIVQGEGTEAVVLLHGFGGDAELALRHGRTGRTSGK